MAVPFLPSFHPRHDQLAVQKYEELFPAFSDSRECKLMKVRADPFPCPFYIRAWEWVVGSLQVGGGAPVSRLAEIIVVLKGFSFLFCFPSSAIWISIFWIKSDSGSDKAGRG